MNTRKSTLLSSVPFSLISPNPMHARRGLGMPQVSFAPEGGGGGGGDDEAAQIAALRANPLFAKAVAAEVQGLKDKNSELLGKNVKLTNDNKALKEAADAHAAEIEELNNTHAEAIKQATAGKPDEAAIQKRVDTAVANAQKKWEKDNKPKLDRLPVVEAALREALVDGAAQSAIAAEEGVADLLLPHVQKRIKVEEYTREDGTIGFKAVPLDKAGNPLAGDKGEPGKIVDLVKEFKASETFGMAFKGTGRQGTGAGAGAGGGSTTGQVNPWAEKTWNLTAQAKIIRENPALAEALRKQAGVLAVPRTPGYKRST